MIAPVIIVPGNNTVRPIGSHVWMTLGLAAGLGLGLAAVLTHSPLLLAATQWLRPLGTLFVNLLSMVVIPLVATALFAGIAGLGALRRVGLIRVVRWVRLLAPLGICAIVAGAVAKFGLDLIKTMAVFILTVIAGLAVFIAVVSLPAGAVVGRLGARRYLRAIRASLLMAFSTTSSRRP